MRYHLPADKMPTAWFNVLPRLPEPLQPPLHPGTREPVGPDDLAPAVPDGAHRAGDVGRRRGSTSPARCSTSCGCGGRRRSCGPTRLEQALGTPARIYFKDESVSPGRLAQAEHRRAAGLLQQGRGHHAADHRDRRRPVGHRAGVRLRAVRPRVQGVHGPRVVRPEAVPQGDDGDLGRGVRALAGRRSRRRPARSGSPSPTRCATPPAATTPTTRSARCSTTCCCTRRSSASRPRSSWRMAGETRPDVVIAPCGGGSNLGGLSLPFVEDADVRLRGGRAVVVPDADRGPLRVRLRRHRGHDPAAADVHARPRLHAAAASTPAGCATTATRRSSATLVQDGPDGGHRLPAGQGVRGRRSCSPTPRARSRRPRPPTASGPPSTRRWRPRRPARSG